MQRILILLAIFSILLNAQENTTQPISVSVLSRLQKLEEDNIATKALIAELLRKNQEENIEKQKNIVQLQHEKQTLLERLQNLETELQQAVTGTWSSNSSWKPRRKGPFFWDREIVNTNKEYLGWIPGQDHIIIKKSGHYLICASVLQMELKDKRGDVYLKRNEDFFCLSLGSGCSDGHFKHNLSIVAYFNSGDRLYVYQDSEDGTQYCHTGDWSTLSVVRLGK